MRHVFFRIAIALFVGMLANLGAAWWIASRTPVGRVEWWPFEKELPKRYRSDVPEEFEQRQRWPKQSALALTVFSYRAHAFRSIMYGVSEEIPGLNVAHPQRLIVWRQSGWPMLAFESLGHLDVHKHSEFHGAIPDQENWPVGIMPPEWLRERIDLPVNQPFRPGFTYTAALPIRPIWPGASVNLLLYASAFYFLLYVPGYLVRRRRARTGRCVHCRYDLRGADHTRCPECGSAITSIRPPRNA